MRRAFAGLVAGALLLVAGPSRAEDSAEGPREDPAAIFLSPTNAHGIQTHLVVRVVDDATGAPIPGATIGLFSQDEQPVTGLVPATRTGVVDEDGWVRVRVDDLGWPDDYAGSYLGSFWSYVEAPGRSGLAMVEGRTEEEVRLGPAIDVVVEVHDALDRPVSGAVIGVRSSRTCGHMPDQRISVAGSDGRAVLRSLGFEGFDEDAMGWESWTVADGIESDYDDVRVARRRRSPQVFRFRPSRPIEGTVLGADRTPAVGVAVGSRGGNHRGPWTKTGPGGHFRLVGAPPFVDLTVLPTEGGAPEVVFTAPPPGIGAVVRLPKEGEAPAKAVEVDLTVRRRGEAQDADAPDPRLFAVRDGDGMTLDRRLERLPPGTWTIRAGGGVTPYEPASVRVEVPDAKDPPEVAATLELVRRPAVKIALEGGPKGVVVALLSENEARDLTDEEIASGSVPLPTDAPAVFRVKDTSTGRVAFFPVPAQPPPAGAPPIALRAPRAVVVRARLVGPDGPVAGRLRADVDALLDARHYVEDDPETPAAVAVEASVLDTGTVELIAVPEGRTLRPRIVTAEIGPEAVAKGSLDLGEIRLEPRGDPRLVVLDRAGKPLKVESFRVIRDGFVREGETAKGAEPSAIDPRIPPLEPGDVVEVEARWEGEDADLHLAKPVRLRLDGPGPWTLRAAHPATSIELAAGDEEGKPLDAMLVLDGAPYGEAWSTRDGKGEPFVLEGLDAGHHRVAVAARNRVTQVYDLVLKEGERRVLSPRLRPVPAPAKK